MQVERDICIGPPAAWGSTRRQNVPFSSNKYFTINFLLLVLACVSVFVDLSVYQCICCSVKLLVQKDMEVARGRGKTSHLYCSAAGGTFSPLEEEPHHQHHGQHHRHHRPQNHYYCQDCFAMNTLNNMKKKL